ncbi:Gp37Gp68 family protein [Paraburkholderia atlantica]|uniref:Gp37Gp68 family protein n=1 Tax=Paraburkholderia atlantica TaxID=2654982 RepID=D5WMB0_PARAM|nr:phage Gp37/Gp68 family protein [Paraburkholderia atlantica]ADG20356.1 Gp37Gp68 family protein [Paraburkholderia atlantica]
MSDNTKIEWTDATWNIVTGCDVTSPGCKNCYAMKLAGTRLRNHPSRAGLTRPTAAGPVWTGEVRFNDQWLDQPFRWTQPRMIFVCAHGDLFHESVRDEWIDKVFAVMARARQHTYQVLTKRADRMREYLSHPVRHGRMLAASHEIGWAGMEWCQWPLPNVWLGVSVEDQKRADERIPALLKCPAAVRWISAEPLLGPIDLTCIEIDEMLTPTTRGRISALSTDDENRYFQAPHALDWVVVGGESGSRARPMHPDWARSLRDQCAEACVPFLFKQWGEWAPGSNWPDDIAIPSGELCNFDNPLLDDAGSVWRVGKKAAGRLLDGRTHDEFPEMG